MTVVLQIGDQELSEPDLYPLLAQYKLLPQLAKEIIIDQAIASIDCTPEEETLGRQQFYQKHQIANETQLQEWVKYHGITPEQLAHLTVRDIKLEKFKKLTWEHQLESYFLKSKGKLDRVVYSLIRTKDPGIAQELYFRIAEGESSFTELAKQYSQGAEAQTGGLIGPVELNVPHPTISQILSTSQPGQLSPPHRVGEWFVILRLEKYLTAQLDEATKGRLLNELFQEWLSNELKKVTFEGTGNREQATV
ncbi:PpiC-type peptidyl-prolyl cis-trans isomerase [Rippkaea orientalis PCC 8801]|uniref:peptidylprolyl isomerase n=1 Tax=Rippkaea orientalis (strain PCC 8801 / RF-1) TaxID=41431 RepID=B7JVP9_RIPO1|nr:peptidylprolyl isomerase [Rippkaea orientalis]ACK64620.1 PpiC-type peptidyl-prolyl cis-trans isomerase [Rippkaea orientalis PCC 8801]